MLLRLLRLGKHTQVWSMSRWKRLWLFESEVGLCGWVLAKFVPPLILIVTISIASAYQFLDSLFLGRKRWYFRIAVSKCSKVPRFRSLQPITHQCVICAIKRIERMPFFQCFFELQSVAESHSSCLTKIATMIRLFLFSFFL